jgi:hypothetical protein
VETIFDADVLTYGAYQPTAGKDYRTVEDRNLKRFFLERKNT